MVCSARYDTFGCRNRVLWITTPPFRLPFIHAQVRDINTLAIAMRFVSFRCTTGSTKGRRMQEKGANQARSDS